MARDERYWADIRRDLAEAQAEYEKRPWWWKLWRRVEVWRDKRFADKHGN